MNNTKIEWCDRTANPVKGYCPMACSYCYARAMYDRFKWPKEIRFRIEALCDMPKKPKRIFVGSTIELFGEWVPDDWMQRILYQVEAWPQHTFIFLTKRPERLIRWNPWPGNAWVGVSTCDRYQAHQAFNFLQSVDAKVKFLSIEPLLDDLTQILYWKGLLKFVNWLIIGAQTGKGAVPPEKEWVQEIIDAADQAGVPVFLKDNLKWLVKRQEWPSLLNNRGNKDKT